MILIHYVKNGVELCARTRDIVPRVGERVQLADGLFVVDMITYQEDGFLTPTPCYIELIDAKKTAIRYRNRGTNDNYGNC